MTKTVHRFFVDPEVLPVDQGGSEGVMVEISNRDQVHQISRVLRMQPGDEIVLLNGTGQAWRAAIQSIESRCVFARLDSPLNVQTEPSIRLRLFQAIPKQLSKFEQVLRQGTELGVREFYPLLTAHGEVSELRKRPRLESILLEAAEQSERAILPVLAPEISFAEILENGWPSALQADATLMAYAREETTPLSSILSDWRTSKTTIQSLNLLIGPEGGFSAQEVQLARESGIHLVGLGPRILRTETAGLALVSAILLGTL